MLKRVMGIVILGLCLLIPINAFAASYDVSAVVHAPLPPNLPIVTGPTNRNQENAGVYISGTCTIIVPTIIVVLVRDNQTIGTGNCSAAGTFDIYVGLVLGANVIYPKFLTITGQFSGYGAPIVINYELPTKTGESADLSVEELLLGFDYDFVSYNNLVSTSIKYSIKGGKAPYAVVVSWGDNTQKKYQVKSSGEQNIEHKYKAILPPSQITIQVTDSAGKKTIQSRALVSFRDSVYVPPAAPLRASHSNWLPVWYVGVFSFGSILMVRHYKHLMHLKLKTKTKQIKLSKKR